MKNIPPLARAIVQPDQCRVVEAFGDEVTFLLTGAETGGRFTMFLSVTPPGMGPPPHLHVGDDEWFHVLEGRAAFFKDGGWIEVPPGTSVFIPHGTVHTFRNAGDTPLKQLVHASPSGFETFFTRCAEQFKQEGGPDMGRIMEIADEHGIRFV